MTGIDFVDPERGLTGSFRSEGPGVVFDHDDVIAASPDAGASLGDGDAVDIELDGVSVGLELSSVGATLSLEGERIGDQRLTVCRVLGELKRNGDAQQFACLGVRSEEVTAADAADNSLTRSIAVAFSDGGLLALRGARPGSASEHGDEELRAAVASAAGEVTEVREPLLSTQYDAEGRHVRATLELWPERDGEDFDPPLRAAGSIVCGTSLSLGDQRLDIAFFHWSMSGRPGLGRYEVLSAPSPG